MTWEGVPWMVDEADHSAEVGRTLAYAATGGNEGVVAPGDCKVVASAIPDGNVHINTGAVVVLNQFPGGGQQSYVVRNEGDEVIALDPQGSSGVRYDLVALIVQDPQYAGQPAPVSVPDGPYVDTVVYKDVGPDASTLAEVDPDQSGYVLARVKFDASDGTINPVDITDLRVLANPKGSRKLYNIAAPINDHLTEGAFVRWPDIAQSVKIPMWATKATMKVDLSSYVHFAPATAGYVRARLGDLIGAEVAYHLTSTIDERTALVFAGSFDIPEAMRGTTVEAYLQARRAFYTGHISTYETPITLFDISFEEATV
jgi:hypothetical protein